MHIAASVRNCGSSHEVTVATAGVTRAISIPAKSQGPGSSVNGGELLMLALATCYGNDLYREAARIGIEVRGLEVVAEADFDGVGLAASNVRYRAKVDSPAPAATIEKLLAETDAVAEVHNTMRAGVPVVREGWEK